MSRSRLIAFTFLLTAACSGGDAADDGASADTAADNPGATASAPAGGPESCLVGTWTQSSPSFSPQFVFNADGTGEETTAASQGGEVRSFNWTAKDDDEVTISFPKEGDQMASSTDWSVDCEAGTFAHMYSKQ